MIFRSRLTTFHYLLTLPQKAQQFYRKMSDKPAVYITRQLNQEALDLLNQHCTVSCWNGEDPVPRSELLKNIQDKQGLLCMLTDKVDEEVINTGRDLKVVSTMSAGFDHLNLEALRKRNIRIGYTPGILSAATAELTVALLLATSRRLLEANEEARNGGWKAWSPFWMCGPGLNNSTVGIVGLGRIGFEIAKRLQPFGVKQILYHSRTEKSEAAKINAKKVSFEDLLTQSDFIIACCALTPETQGLFNAEAFRKMKKTAVFVNSARGGVVDQEALIEALKKGEIWGAGLDVTTPEPLPVNNELFKLKNCVILPHIGSASIETRNDMGVMSAQNLIEGLKGGEMPAELK